MNIKIPEVKRVLGKAAISIKICLDDTQAIADIILSAAKLTILGLGIRSYRDQPQIEQLREILDPAYLVVADILARYYAGTETLPIVVSNIYGLSVDLSPTSGYMKLRVTYKLSETNKQSFNISIYALDSKTILMRNATKPVISAGRDRHIDAVTDMERL